jgi:hypothetical protein
MSQARRERRLAERQGKKFYDRIRQETVNKLKKLSPAEQEILKAEYAEFIKQNQQQ